MALMAAMQGRAISAPRNLPKKLPQSLLSSPTKTPSTPRTGEPRIEPRSPVQLDPLRPDFERQIEKLVVKSKSNNDQLELAILQMRELNQQLDRSRARRLNGEVTWDSAPDPYFEVDSDEEEKKLAARKILKPKSISGNLSPTKVQSPSKGQLPIKVHTPIKAQSPIKASTPTTHPKQKSKSVAGVQNQQQISQDAMSPRVRECIALVKLSDGLKGEELTNVQRRMENVFRDTASDEREEIILQMAEHEDQALYTNNLSRQDKEGLSDVVTEARKRRAAANANDPKPQASADAQIFGKYLPRISTPSPSAEEPAERRRAAEEDMTEYRRLMRPKRPDTPRPFQFVGDATPDTLKPIIAYQLEDSNDNLQLPGAACSQKLFDKIVSFGEKFVGVDLHVTFKVGCGKHQNLRGTVIEYEAGESLTFRNAIYPETAFRKPELKIDARTIDWLVEVIEADIPLTTNFKMPKKYKAYEYVPVELRAAFNSQAGHYEAIAQASAASVTPAVAPLQRSFIVNQVVNTPPSKDVSLVALSRSRKKGVSTDQLTTPTRPGRANRTPQIMEAGLAVSSARKISPMIQQTIDALQTRAPVHDYRKTVPQTKVSNSMGSVKGRIEDATQKSNGNFNATYPPSITIAGITIPAGMGASASPLKANVIVNHTPVASMNMITMVAYSDAIDYERAYDMILPIGGQILETDDKWRGRTTEQEADQLTKDINLYRLALEDHIDRIYDDVRGRMEKGLVPDEKAYKKQWELDFATYRAVLEKRVKEYSEMCRTTLLWQKGQAGPPGLGEAAQKHLEFLNCDEAEKIRRAGIAKAQRDSWLAAKSKTMRLDSADLLAYHRYLASLSGFSTQEMVDFKEYERGLTEVYNEELAAGTKPRLAAINAAIKQGARSEAAYDGVEGQIRKAQETRERALELAKIKEEREAERKAAEAAGGKKSKKAKKGKSGGRRRK